MKQTKIICALLILLIISSAIWLIFRDNPRQNLAKEDDWLAGSELSLVNDVGLATSTGPEDSLLQTAQLIVNYGSSQPLSFDLVIDEQSTAFSLLQASGLNIDYKESDFGVFVKAIGEKVNGQDNRYWLYYLNNEMPMVAADKQPVVAGDKAEWKFEESNF